jgi:uncharacterized membrane protein YidH (DUF202 family)
VPSTVQPDDAGAALERTALAWTRTSIAMSAVVILLLRDAMTAGPGQRVALCGAIAASTANCLFGGAGRLPEADEPCGQRARAQVRRLSLAVVLLAAVALLATLAPAVAVGEA